ncbi:MAG: hypothetical protein A2X58_03605 [Nitrospirae bacterium GWC2_56_14]|nr:MAG: hypothetical protein A2X58_03605 [Nitrospirae bacterium GWC2_56_14]
MVPTIMIVFFQHLLLIMLTLFPAIMPSAALGADGRDTLFREDFENLDNWKPFFFPKIKKHSTYTIETNDKDHILKAESSGSASAVVYKNSFNIYEHPRVTWRWKIGNVYTKGDARTKEGDDYPIRVYIMFEYEPEHAGAFEKLQYGVARSIYGEYPPHSSLSYVWANKDDPDRFLKSPYTDRAMMVLLEKGRQKAGTWQEVEINVLEDYQQAFGEKPPARARIAVMNDSDNTGESAVSYMDYIEVFK